MSAVSGLVSMGAVNRDGDAADFPGTTRGRGKRRAACIKLGLRVASSRFSVHRSNAQTVLLVCHPAASWSKIG